jgi:Predicted transporter component
LARILAALAAGLLFGAGLTVAQMIDPAVVLAFLDLASIPTGGWDPRLAFVMAGALAVTAIGYRLVFKGRGRPLFAARFALPAKLPVDRRLIAGAVLFGLGWGLVGYCPGPALAGLGVGPAKTWLFVAAMLVGMGGYHLAVVGLRGRRQSERLPAK